MPCPYSSDQFRDTALPSPPYSPYSPYSPSPAYIIWCKRIWYNLVNFFCRSGISIAKFGTFSQYRMTGKLATVFFYDNRMRNYNPKPVPANRLMVKNGSNKRFSRLHSSWPAVSYPHYKRSYYRLLLVLIVMWFCPGDRILFMSISRRRRLLNKFSVTLI
jgi:hypothetical protein